MKFAALTVWVKMSGHHISRRGKLGQDASIDWAIGVMNEGNVVADFDGDLVGNGSHADLKVVALSSVQVQRNCGTRVTNFGCNSVEISCNTGLFLKKEP